MRDTYTDGAAFVHLIGPFDQIDGLYLITHVGTFRKDRGQGHARAVMARVLADADAEGVVLGLSVQSDPDVDYQRLVDWYADLGFRRFEEDDPTAMRRDPLPTQSQR